MKKIDILIPAYNEELTIDLLYERLNNVINNIENYKFEMLFVNDGSSDMTLEKIKYLREKDNRISYIDLSRNFGKETAMIAGLDYITGDAVIIIDADLQDPPELIPEMIKWWEEGYDDVYAKRRSRKGESFLKKYSALMYYKVLTLVSNVQIQENTGDFRLLDRRCIDALKKIREAQRYTKGMFSWIGYNKKEILFDRDSRIAGSTKWNYFKLFNLAIDGITSFTITPLRLSSLMGVLISSIAFIYMISVILRALLYGGTVQEYPTLICITLFMGGIQLVSLGIMGEYIGRMFNETKHRPLYFVKEHNDKRVD